MRALRWLAVVALILAVGTGTEGTAGAAAGPRPLLFLTDFGLADGAVAEMKGVAFAVDRTIPLFDVTHQIPPEDVWTGAHRLRQTAPYWPAGTVFVSVVDPGVGTSRRSIVLRAKNGSLFVSPDNGLLTLVADELGVDAVREIDEGANRLPSSRNSYTFHGRDVYAFTGARLAAGVVRFEEVGPPLSGTMVRLPYERARRDGAAVVGTVDVLDPAFGNVWSNVDRATFEGLGVAFGDRIHVEITHENRTRYAGDMPYVRTFGDVAPRAPLAYFNSLDGLSFGLNLGDFAAVNHVESGPTWRVRVTRVVTSGRRPPRPRPRR